MPKVQNISNKERTNNMEAADVIKFYLTKDFSIIPLKEKEKFPTFRWKKYQKERSSLEDVEGWISQNPNSNWGIVTGSISGIVVVDIDDLKGFKESGLKFPNTVTAKTGKGLHLYFKHPGIAIKNEVKRVESWFDIRGDGGYVVAPPSIHPNKSHYEWEEGFAPWECELAELPKWLLDKLKNGGTSSRNNIPNSTNNQQTDWNQIIKYGTTEGGRNELATKYVGRLFAKKLSFEEVLEMSLRWNRKNNPPLPELEIKGIVESIYKLDLKNNGKQYVMDTPYIRSFLNEHGEEVYEKGSFKHTVLAKIISEELPLYRNGKYFFFYDEQDGLWKLGAEDKLKFLIAEKLDIHTNNNRVNETFNHIVRTTPVDQGSLPFEKENPYVLNLRNGVLNLQTGKFSPEFNPNYFHRIKLPLTYDPSATSEEIDKFLSEILYSEDIPFIHEVAASILAKKMINPALIFLLGSGGNGKSKLLNLLSRLAGIENTANIPMEVLQNDRFATAELYMKLLNYCGDIGDGWLAQSDILKTATGGDPLYAQYKGKDPFKFISFAVQVYSANTEPKFRDLSDGMKDRIYPIRMDRKFRGLPSENVDPLAKIDDNQLSGWLNKLVIVFQNLMKRHGRYLVSEGMSLKRDEWFHNMDLVGQFIKEECFVKGGGKDVNKELIISKKELWIEFNHYLSSNGYSAKFTKQTFEKQLLKYNITERKQRLHTMNPIHCYVGICLNKNTPF